MGEQGEFLPHVIFAGVFDRLTAPLLMQDDHRKNKTLRRIFDMYEELASDGADRRPHQRIVGLYRRLSQSSVSLLLAFRREVGGVFR